MRAQSLLCASGTVRQLRQLAPAVRAGGSNLFEADGATYHYHAFGPAGEGYFKAHTPCIDAVKQTGATYIIWCPGLMRDGARTTPAPKTLLFADPSGLAAWDFVSYRACVVLPAPSSRPTHSTRRALRAEDAAQVMVSAVETTEFDNKHISALSPPPPRQQSSDL